MRPERIPEILPPLPLEVAKTARLLRSDPPSPQVPYFRLLALLLRDTVPAHASLPPAVVAEAVSALLYHLGGRELLSATLSSLPLRLLELYGEELLGFFPAPDALLLYGPSLASAFLRQRLPSASFEVADRLLADGFPGTLSELCSIARDL